MLRSIPIFLASVALEPARWKSPRRPSIRVSEFNETASASGFSGWELWEFHYTMADSEERANLRTSPLPVKVFNSYALPGLSPEPLLRTNTEAIHELAATLRAVKFNLGPDGTDLDAQISAALHWAEMLPAHVRLLCECHAGTVLENLPAVKRAFAAWPVERFGAIVHPFSQGPDQLRQWLEVLGERIEHLHLQCRGIDNSFTSPEFHPTGVQEALRCLQAYGFSGTASIEFVHGTGKPGESPHGLLQQAVRDLHWLRAS